MLNSFNEYQRIVVFGGKSEIALSIVIQVPKSRAAEIILIGRNILSFKTPAELCDFRVTCIELDFVDTLKTKKVTEEIFSTGDVDLVITAYGVLNPFDDQLSDSTFQNILSINLLSQATLLNQIASKMNLQKHGQILHISSVAGLLPRASNFVYGASKLGVDFIARGLQPICFRQNVFLTILRPGFVHTKMTTGLKEAPFAIEVASVAKTASRALRRRRPMAYAPSILRPLMWILQNLPARIVSKLDSLD